MAGGEGDREGRGEGGRDGGREGREGKGKLRTQIFKSRRPYDGQCDARHSATLPVAECRVLVAWY